MKCRDFERWIVAYNGGLMTGPKLAAMQEHERECDLCHQHAELSREWRRTPQEQREKTWMEHALKRVAILEAKRKRREEEKKKGAG